jgi:hypothetical protein
MLSLISGLTGYLVSGLTNIQPDIQYPAFRLAGYPAGLIYGQISTGIRCIPILKHPM